MLLTEYSVYTSEISSRPVTMGTFKCDRCEAIFERRMSLVKGKTTHFCSLKCVNKDRKHTEEWKINTSNSMLGEKNHFYGKHHSIETSEQLSIIQSERFAQMTPKERLENTFGGLSVLGEKNPFFGKNHSVTSREQMSKTRATKIANGEIWAQAHGRFGIYHSKKAGEVRYDSSYEYVRMVTLDNDDGVVSWTKKHGIKLQYVLNDVKKFYVPDFFVVRKTNSCIEECKGYELESTIALKMNALAVYCAQNNLSFQLFRVSDMEKMAQMTFGKSLYEIRKELPK
ncbi:MAG TPA: NUMOD3 domain-containing DNA-binding protein [Rhabdochlamydiaceae bacterium]